MRSTRLPCLILPMLSACHIHIGGWDHEEKHAVAGNVPITGALERCRIDLPIADLKIVPGQSGELRWRGTCRLKYDDHSVASVAPWQLEVRESGGLIELRQKNKDAAIAVHELDFHLTVEVPPEVPLEVKVGIGDVEVRDHRHPLRVETGIGDVRLASCSGDALLRSGIGTIRATGHGGAVDAESGVGDVRLELDEQNTDAAFVRLHAGIGDVDLLLPHEAGVVETSSDTRSTRRSNRRGLRTAGIGGSFTGQLGATGPRVDASAGTGDVNIRTR